MYEMKALTSFDHHGSYRADDKFKVGSKRHAEELEKKGLASIVGEPEADKANAKTDGEQKAPAKRAAKKAAD